ncbi:MAG: Gfo/Idh/MocA family oxidoreductase [Deltaproteobacteria bacterium]|nr:Gfo/Idh/MocA family oxidoreductase [Deltaproteobacteria bacterium]
MQNSKKRFIIIGCGSIGQRHLKNLLALGVRDFILCDTSAERLEKIKKEFSIENIYIDYKKAIKENKDITAAVIATPSSLHVPMAMDCAKAGINLFIEKPLSHKMDGVDELIKIAKKKKLIAMMAMCYRFHPVFLKIKSMLDKKAIGKIYHVNYYGGHYLPDWHPNMDYRKEYAAHKKLGGGVLLTSIHGFDNIRWLFGDVKEVAAFVDKISSLEIDADDIVAGIFKMKKGFYVSASTDFLQRAGQHRMVIAGEKGTIRCDFSTGLIERYDVKKKNWIQEKVNFEINAMYVKETKYFLDCLKNKKQPLIDLDEGKRTLKLALAIKESSEKRRFVNLT